MMGAPYIDTLHASSLPGVGRVCVYKNLNRPGYYSVAAVKGSMGRGKVVAYARTVYLRNVVGTVPTARTVQRLKDAPNKREVCAWLVGDLGPECADYPALDGLWWQLYQRGTHNPCPDATRGFHFTSRGHLGAIAVPSVRCRFDGTRARCEVL